MKKLVKVSRTRIISNDKNCRSGNVTCDPSVKSLWLKLDGKTVNVFCYGNTIDITVWGAPVVELRKISTHQNKTLSTDVSVLRNGLTESKTTDITSPENVK